MALLAPGHQSRYIDARQHAAPVLQHVVEDEPSTERHPHRHVLPEQPVEILRGDVGLEHRAQEVAAHGVGALTQQSLDEARCPREVHDRADLRRIRLCEPRHERAHAGLVDQHQRRDAVGAVQIDVGPQYRAAHRVAQQVRLLDSELFEQFVEIGGQRGDARTVVRGAGFTVVAVVIGDHAVAVPTALHAGDGIEASPIRHCVERLTSPITSTTGKGDRRVREAPQGARTAGVALMFGADRAETRPATGEPRPSDAVSTGGTPSPPGRRAPGVGLG